MKFMSSILVIGLLNALFSDVSESSHSEVHKENAVLKLMLAK